MKHIGWIAVLALVVAACTEPAVESGPTATTEAGTPTSSPVATTVPGSSNTSTDAPSPAGSLSWQDGTATCAEMDRDFPLGADDHGVYLDRGLVSYYRPGVSEDAVEEVLIQFVNDPTCGAESDAWTFMISHLLDPQRLYRAGELCEFYAGLTVADPPPANRETILEHLADAEQLCG